MCGIIFQISDKKINTENLKKSETFGNVRKVNHHFRFENYFLYIF